MASKSMLEALLNKQLSLAPEPQPYYTFVDGHWRSSADDPPTNPGQGSTLTSLHLITWNIDFRVSFPRARMESALSHLRELVSQVPPTSAVVIFLQEMVESENISVDVRQDANDLSQLQRADWIREKFCLTDISPEKWRSTYGTVTLFDRRLDVQEVSRLPFISEYGRDALLVDLKLQKSENLLRLCNVHLDSARGSMRPIQWKGSAQELQGKEIQASILAGDCNANQPRDKTEPSESGFKDAYLELGGEEDESGATWGYQSLNWERWGLQRLDKILYWGKVEVKNLERIGVGVKVQDEEASRELIHSEGLDFVTDHYGLMARFYVPDELVVRVHVDAD